jgi:hypothetical protein
MWNLAGLPMGSVNWTVMIGLILDTVQTCAGTALITILPWVGLKTGRSGQSFPISRESVMPKPCEISFIFRRHGSFFPFSSSLR